MTEVPELAAALYRADWTRLSLSAKVTRRRDKAVHRQLHKLVMAERMQAMGPVPRTWRLPEYDPYSGADWPESEQRVLLAQGGRYRVGADDNDLAVVCDGESIWAIHDGMARRYPAEGPDYAFRGLVAGEASVGGRRGYRVVAEARDWSADLPGRAALLPRRGGRRYGTRDPAAPDVIPRRPASDPL